MQSTKKSDKAATEEPPEWVIPKYSFTIQFAWQEKLLRVRLQDRQKKKLEAQKQAEEARLQGTPAPTTPATN